MSLLEQVVQVPGPVVLDLEAIERNHILALGRLRRAAAQVAEAEAKPSRWQGPPVPVLMLELTAAVRAFAALNAYAQEAAREVAAVSPTVAGAVQ